ncbi:hypothetical protein ACFWXA_18220 [Streptomyces atroolivaceus]
MYRLDSAGIGGTSHHGRFGFSGRIDESRTGTSAARTRRRDTTEVPHG